MSEAIPRMANDRLRWQQGATGDLAMQHETGSLSVIDQVQTVDDETVRETKTIGRESDLDTFRDAHVVHARAGTARVAVLVQLTHQGLPLMEQRLHQVGDAVTRSVELLNDQRSGNYLTGLEPGPQLPAYRVRVAEDLHVGVWTIMVAKDRGLVPIVRQIDACDTDQSLPIKHLATPVRETAYRIVFRQAAQPDAPSCRYGGHRAPASIAQTREAISYVHQRRLKCPCAGNAAEHEARAIGRARLEAISQASGGAGFLAI